VTPQPTPEQNLASTVLENVRAMEGLSGSITLHVQSGRVVKIESRRFMNLASTGMPMTP
jgi:hypothetical protein